MLIALSVVRALELPTFEATIDEPDMCPLALILPATIKEPEISNSDCGSDCPIPTLDATFWLLALTPNKTFWELSNVPGLNLKSLPCKDMSKYLFWSVLFNLNKLSPLFPSIIALVESELET